MRRLCSWLAVTLVCACSSSGSETPAETGPAGDAATDGPAEETKDGTAPGDTPSDGDLKTPPGKIRCGPGGSPGPPLSICDASKEDCCADTVTCMPRGKCPGLAFQCTSAASCAAGQKCCIDPPTAGPPAAKCQASCAQITVCDTKDECAAGETCSPDPVGNTCKK